MFVKVLFLVFSCWSSSNLFALTPTEVAAIDYIAELCDAHGVPKFQRLSNVFDKLKSSLSDNRQALRVLASKQRILLAKAALNFNVLLNQAHPELTVMQPQVRPGTAVQARGRSKARPGTAARRVHAEGSGVPVAHGDPKQAWVEPDRDLELRRQQEEERAVHGAMDKARIAKLQTPKLTKLSQLVAGLLSNLPDDKNPGAQEAWYGEFLKFVKASFYAVKNNEVEFSQLESTFLMGLSRHRNISEAILDILKMGLGQPILQDARYINYVCAWKEPSEGLKVFSSLQLALVELILDPGQMYDLINIYVNPKRGPFETQIDAINEKLRRLAKLNDVRRFERFLDFERDEKVRQDLAAESQVAAQATAKPSLLERRGFKFFQPTTPEEDAKTMGLQVGLRTPSSDSSKEPGLSSSDSQHQRMIDLLDGKGDPAEVERMRSAYAKIGTEGF